jgi:hypothetical protein
MLNKWDKFKQEQAARDAAARTAAEAEAQAKAAEADDAGKVADSATVDGGATSSPSAQ